jgi:phosphoribosylformylglycinamidine synthase
MVGKLPDASKAGRLGFLCEGDAIAIVGNFEPSLAGSELAKLLGEEPHGPLPHTDSRFVRDAQRAVRMGVRSEALHNAHDIAEGGLAVALAECCLAGGVGASVELPEDFELFAEAPGRAFIVSGPRELLNGHRLIGSVGGQELEISGRLKLPITELRRVRDGGAPLGLPEEVSHASPL